MTSSPPPRKCQECRTPLLAKGRNINAYSEAGADSNESPVELETLCHAVDLTFLTLSVRQKGEVTSTWGFPPAPANRCPKKPNCELMRLP
ncbi:hypothetical protein DMENIID0001_049840 [Sergentomyia squamirostris]